MTLIDDRFLSKVEKSPNGCWLWTGAISMKGYARFGVNGRNCHGHRVSYQLFRGDIPDGMQVCHKCDNPRCVRPDHLFIGDNSANQRDAVAKKRHFQVKKTHCAKGHEYSSDNTYYRSNGNRICKQCAKKFSHDAYERAKIH